MSNIYEALLNADQDQQHLEKFEIDQVAVTDISSTSPKVNMEQEMISLYRQIDTLLPDSPSIVLQFIGTHLGGGVSTIVREYAFMAETRLGKSVLILDTNQSESDQQHFFRIKNQCGWNEAVSAPEAMEKFIFRIDHSNLYVSGLSRRSGVSPILLNSCQLKSLFMGFKKRFDIVLLDSSLVAGDTDNTALSRSVDGVLLVVEADKTRWPVAEKLKTKIHNNGGNILGIVFNKRRYYIPEFLYRGA